MPRAKRKRPEGCKCRGCFTCGECIHCGQDGCPDCSADMVWGRNGPEKRPPQVGKSPLEASHETLEIAVKSAQATRETYLKHREAGDRLDELKDLRAAKQNGCIGWAVKEIERLRAERPERDTFAESIRRIITHYQLQYLKVTTIKMSEADWQKADLNVDSSGAKTLWRIPVYIYPYSDTVPYGLEFVVERMTQ